jgi:hypothetical protein
VPSCRPACSTTAKKSQINYPRQAPVAADRAVSNPRRRPGSRRRS